MPTGTFGPKWDEGTGEARENNSFIIFGHTLHKNYTTIKSKEDEMGGTHST
jgi:hypothetical protein